MLKDVSKISNLQSAIVTLAVVTGALFFGTGIYFGVRELEEPRRHVDLPGFQSGQDVVIARVNGYEIRMSDVVMGRADLPPGAEGLPEAMILEIVINGLIDRRLFAEAGWKAGLGRDGIMRGRFRYEQDKILRDQYVAGMIETHVAERDIKRLYAERYLKETTLREAHLWQILVRSREEAEELVRELDAGALFADLARRHSLDGFAVVGGDMGYHSADTLLPEVADRVFYLEEGTVSLPFKSRFGWHLVWMKDLRLKTPPALMTVRNELRQELIEAAMLLDLDKLRAEAKIRRVGPSLEAELDRALVASQ
jgi:peptidyl-prolyl cis-trans isomerase C